MDKETLQIIDEIVTRAVDAAVNKVVAKMRMLYDEDLRLFCERIDRGFETVHRRFDVIEAKMDAGFREMNLRIDEPAAKMEQVGTKMDQVENALQVLISEMRADRNELKNK